MGITFQCEYCGKKIEASDSAGGRWGKCPSCHNKLYVPNLDSGEELKLAPVDKSDQARQKQLMAETRKLSQDISREKETPNGPAGAAPSAIGISDKELTENIITYLRQMVNGELDQAQQTADLITPYGRRVVKILDRISLSEMPESGLADIPQQVISGLIRDLRSRVS